MAGGGGGGGSDDFGTMDHRYNTERSVLYLYMHGQSERCGEVPGAVISMLLRGEYPDDFTKEWRRLTSGGAAETNNSQMAF